MVNVSQNASRLKSPAVAKIDEYAEWGRTQAYTKKNAKCMTKLDTFRIYYIFILRDTWIMHILSLCTISQLFTNSSFLTLLILLYCQFLFYILYFNYHLVIFESFWSLKILVGQSFIFIKMNFRIYVG
jgi:hypothetical protein